MSQPAWIEKYINTIHNAFIGMVPSHWGSANFFQLIPFLNGAFIEKVHGAIQQLTSQGITPKEATALFSNPSTLRAAIYFLVTEYQMSDHTKKAEARVVLDYLVAILIEMTPDDLFAQSSNRIQTPKEIAYTIGSIKFQNGDEDIARELGRLFNSAAAVAFSLYRDMFPQESNEAYGPYDVSHTFGEQTTLVIKDFSKIYIPEVWPNIPHECEHIQIFQVFKEVDFTCEWIGMHSRYSGNVIQGLRSYAVIKDGKQLTTPESIKELRLALEKMAVEQFNMYDNFSNQDWVHQLLIWECFQFNTFFEKAGIDWRPTQHMIENTKDAVVDIGLSIETFPATIEEYKRDKNYDAYWLLELYC